jgi:hypothetical protein
MKNGLYFQLDETRGSGQGQIMVAQQFIPAIRETIRANEGGESYALGFAQKGDSGASFGVMQGDMHVQPDARDTMNNILAAAGVDQATIDRLMALFKLAWPDGSKFPAEEKALANAALNSAAGRPLVDAMDTRIMAGILKGVDGCIAAASARNVAIEPLALLYIAPWINMTGAPSTLKKWLGGTTVDGYPPPPLPPSVGGDQLAAYLKASKYFRENPRNFTHFTESVKAGAKLLPA